MIRYDVRHRTDFVYSNQVSISHHLLHLTPRPTPNQRTEVWRIALTPAPAIRRTEIDFFGNPVEHLTIQDEHSRLVIQARGTLAVEPPPDVDPGRTPPWEEARVNGSPAVEQEVLAAQPFAYDSPMTRADEEVWEWARRSFPAGRPVLEAALDLNHRIYDGFEYDPNATTVSTPVAEVLRIRRGVCQDFAHLMLAGLRGLGIPARYVSGYLLTYPPPGGQKLQGSDASHAWVSIRVPGHGWVDLDPTNDMMTTTEHITLAWGRDYGDVSPIKGAIVGGGRQVVKVAVDVVPITETAA